MTRRDTTIALAAGGVGLAVLLALTVTVVARRSDPAPEPSPALPEPVAVVASTTAQASSSPVTGEPVETPSVTRPGEVLAREYAVEDLGTGEMLASRKSADVWPLASLTKLMTAEVALRLIPADAPVLIVPVPGGNPSAPGIPVGSTFAMRDVLEIMLVSSSNEAAESLAAQVGREAFLAEMNATAAGWGLANTSFQDPSGLSAGNRSTAREYLELATRVRASHPEVLRLTRQGSATVHAAGTGFPYTGYATHQLIGSPGFLGGKTGYTDEAQGNLLSLFRIGDREVAFVVLGSTQRFTDTRLLLATVKKNQ